MSEAKSKQEIIIGKIVAVDFSGPKVIVSFECDRNGPWRSEMAALIIEDRDNREGGAE